MSLNTNEEQTLIAGKDKHTATTDLLSVVRVFQKKPYANIRHVCRAITGNRIYNLDTG